jgi:hypothetical protein
VTEPVLHGDLLGRARRRASAGSSVGERVAYRTGGASP